MERKARVYDRKARFSSRSGPTTATAVSRFSPTRRYMERLEPSPAISRIEAGGLPNCCRKRRRKICCTGRFLARVVGNDSERTR
jgi:hypothetical protein